MMGKSLFFLKYIFCLFKAFLGTPLRIYLISLGVFMMFLNALYDAFLSISLDVLIAFYDAFEDGSCVLVCDLYSFRLLFAVILR